ncbi:CC0125/CC1285 family lipoprotein [Kordiimonas sp.]|uniref:CC0125/CC1285 family lipoprotein n=1 Tax=Kordiimonas sp. TaxID=1970157 RepID=UPI003A92CF69
MKKMLLTLPVVLMAAACASSGPRYMAASDPGDYGYYESVIEKNRYRVAYKTKGDEAGLAKDYALLRAAELTLEKGYDWFEVVDRDTDIDRSDSHSHAVASMRVHATTYRECGVLSCRTVTRPTYIEPGITETRHAERETTVTLIEIVMGAGKKPDGGAFYEAHGLVETLRDRV